MRLGAAARGDAAPPAHVDDVWIAPFVPGHRIDDPLNPADRFLRVFAVRDHPFHAGHAAHHVAHADVLHLFELLAQIIEGEFALAELLLWPFDLPPAHLLLDPPDLLDQPHQVALAQNPLGHALGMEFFKPIELLAYADKLDGHARDLFDGQRR